MNTPSTTLSPDQFRSLFPALDASTHFASCSQGALSDHLAHTMQRYTSTLMDAAAPWGLWVDKVEEYRVRAGNQLGVDSESIAVLSCASECAYQVLTSLDWSGERNELVTSDLEFPSIGNVWRAQREGIEVINVIGIDAALHAENWIPLITERTKLVSIPVVSYINGTRPDISEVIDHAHSVGAMVFVDAYQAAGVVPFSTVGLDCDFLATGNLKYLLGLPGIAMLYVKDCANIEKPATLTGWFGRQQPFAFNAELIDYPANARRFETGTPPVPSAYAAVAGYDVLQLIDPEDVWTRVMTLRDDLAGDLISAGFTVDLPDDLNHRGPQVALEVETPEEISARLASQSIHVAPRGKRVRISFHAYNNHSDLEKIRQVLGARN